MNQRTPRRDEQTAIDAVSAVVILAGLPIFEPNGPSGLDWRARLVDGRTVDVEVTTCPDDASALAGAVRHCIDTKTKKQQLDHAPSLKWLAMVLDGDAGWRLKHYFSGESRVSQPALQGVAFGYFDEVWTIRETTIGPDDRAVFVVLRLSNGGDTRQPVVVPRPAHAVAGMG